ncbi:LRP4 [Cordylochernes scorpioides]|uniref:LRP4 n=1 Tax=Cordylochernes scorpioides TaxID=51811 RepID=A0ABY6L3B8_9ARAC|nr:LRP4 [Cordylochernes scorpioides]
MRLTLLALPHPEHLVLSQPVYITSGSIVRPVIREVFSIIGQTCSPGSFQLVSKTTPSPSPQRRSTRSTTSCHNHHVPVLHDQSVCPPLGLPHPFSLAVFEDVLYWTDWRNKSIQSANKWTGTEQNVTSIRAGLHLPMDVKVVHPLRQPPAPDPCLNNCSHLCLPSSPTSFTCHCPDGFPLLSDNQTCLTELEQFVAVARREDIRWVCLACPPAGRMAVAVPLRHVGSASGLDWRGGSLVWTDVSRRTVSEALWTGASQRTLLGAGLDAPAGLAVDWLTGLIYWVDQGRIEVASSAYRAVLIWDALIQPRDIAVDPALRQMVWTDLGNASVTPRLERAAMDGSDRRILLESNLTWPCGLSLQDGRVFWADNKRDVLESCNMDGGERQVLPVGEVSRPLGMAVWADLVVWAEPGGLRMAEWASGAGRQDLLRADMEGVVALRVVHRDREATPLVNPCRARNGGCSHLCLLRPSGRSCACPTGVLMGLDGRTCAPGMERYLVAARRNDIRLFSLDVPYLIPVVLPLPQEGELSAMDVDTTQGAVYWASRQKIQRARLQGGVAGLERAETVAGRGLGEVAGLAVDAAARLLYWADSGLRRLMACRLAECGALWRTVLVWEGLESPRAVALACSAGWVWLDLIVGESNATCVGVDKLMFWADWGNSPRLERADMDGTHRRTLVSSGVGWPNGLTADPTHLYWSDARADVSDISHLLLVLAYNYYNRKDTEINMVPVIPRYYNRKDTEINMVPVIPRYYNRKDTEKINMAPVMPRYRYYSRKDTEKISMAPVIPVRRYNYYNRKDTEKFSMAPVIPVRRYKLYNRKDTEKISMAPVIPVRRYNYYNRKDTEKIIMAPVIPVRRYKLYNRKNTEKISMAPVIPVRRYNYYNRKNTEKIDMAPVIPRYNYYNRNDTEKISMAPVIPVRRYNYYNRKDTEKINMAPVIPRYNYYNRNDTEKISMAPVIPRYNYYNRNDTEKISMAPVIEKALHDGTQRTVIVRGAQHPYGLALDSSGALYWGDWESRSLLRQFPGANSTETVRGKLPGLLDLRAVDSSNGIVRPSSPIRTPVGQAQDLPDGLSRQRWEQPPLRALQGLTRGVASLSRWTTLKATTPSMSARSRSCRPAPDAHSAILSPPGSAHTTRSAHTAIPRGRETSPTGRPLESPCGTDNGGCSHLCLRNSTGPSCACPTGILRRTSLTCDTLPSQFLVFACRGSLRRISLDTPDLTDVSLAVQDVYNVVAVDFHWGRQELIFADLSLDAIRVSGLSGESPRTVVTSQVAADGLAVDWVADNLYWTDSGRDSLSVARLDGTSRKTLLTEGLAEPRAIAVLPRKGYLLWTDWGEPAKIERAHLDGSSRRAVITQNLGWPNGLALDSAGRRMFWADAKLDRIESADLAGKHRQCLVEGAAHPFGITLDSMFVYWTDWQTKSIERADKNTGSHRSVLRDGIEYLMEIKMVHDSRQTDTVTIPTHKRMMDAGSNPCGRNNGGCSHLCLYHGQGVTCACPDKPDNRTCLTGQLRHVCMPPHTHGAVYWASRQKIQRARLQGGVAGLERAETVAGRGLGEVAGLAVDAAARLLYWADSGLRRLMACRLAECGALWRTVLVWEGLESPRAVALACSAGLMFWADWGNSPRLERADMDGTHRRTLVSSGVGWPNGLTADPTHLYWSDARADVIEKALHDGTQRTVIVRGAQHPYGLALDSSGALYWGDWESRSLLRQFPGANSTETVRGKLPGLLDLRAVDSSNESEGRTLNDAGPLESPCGTDNGGCSHLCLRNSTGPSCACPTGILRRTSLTCDTLPSQFLVFACRGSLRRISLDTPDLTDVSLAVQDVYNVVAVDFHWGRQELIFADLSLDAIRVSGLSGESPRTVVTSQVAADGLAVDWVADNLYWTDSGRDSLSVARLDGTSRKTLLTEGLAEPRAIAVLPRKGYLLWTDWGEPAKIERAHLDGSSRRAVITQNLGWPNGLALDSAGRRMFWADAKLDRIESADLAGKHRQCLVEGAAHPFGITLDSMFVYWTDWQTKSIERADKNTGSHRSVLRDGIEYLMEIKMVHDSRQTGSNPCGRNNGGCSHLCLYHGQGVTCACPDKPDNRTCLTGQLRHCRRVFLHRSLQCGRTVVAGVKPTARDTRAPALNNHTV